MQNRWVIIVAIVAWETSCAIRIWAQSPPAPLPTPIRSPSPIGSETEILLPAPGVAVDSETPFDPETLLDPNRPGFAEPKRMLSLDEVVSLGLQHNPTLRQTRASVDESLGQSFQATRLPNPTVGYFGEEIGADDAAGLHGLYISQQYVPKIKRDANASVFANEAEARRWDVELARFQVQNTIGLRYYDLLATRQRLELSEQAVVVNRRAVTIIRNLEKIGSVPPRQVTLAELSLKRAELSERTARRDVTAAERALAAVVGLPDLSVVPLGGPDLSVLNRSTLDESDGEPKADGEQNADESEAKPNDITVPRVDPGPDIVFESIWGELCAGSPQLHAARMRVQQSRAAVNAARLAPRPNWQGQLGIGRDSASDDVFATVEIGVTLPINNRFRGDQKSAMANYVRAVGEVERIENVLRDRLARVYRLYSVARVRLLAVQNELLPISERTLANVREDFRKGNAEYLELVNAQQNALQIRREFVEAFRAHNRAVILLRGHLATGGLTAPNAANDLDLDFGSNPSGY